MRDRLINALLAVTLVVALLALLLIFPLDGLIGI